MRAWVQTAAGAEQGDESGHRQLFSPLLVFHQPGGLSAL